MTEAQKRPVAVVVGVGSGLGAALARRFASGYSVAVMARKQDYLVSLVKEIEIIGEAANQISRGEQGRAPEIPWAKIIGMRNRLIHAYADVNIELVWKTVSMDLPILVRQLEAWLAGEP